MFENNWTPFLKEEFEKDYFKKLSSFIHEEYENKTIYPTKKEFNFLKVLSVNSSQPL